MECLSMRTRFWAKAAIYRPKYTWSASLPPSTGALTRARRLASMNSWCRPCSTCWRTIPTCRYSKRSSTWWRKCWRQVTMSGCSATWDSSTPSRQELCRRRICNSSGTSLNTCMPPKTSIKHAQLIKCIPLMMTRRIRWKPYMRRNTHNYWWPSLRITKSYSWRLTISSGQNSSTNCWWWDHGQRISILWFRSLNFGRTSSRRSSIAWKARIGKVSQTKQRRFCRSWTHRCSYALHICKRVRSYWSRVSWSPRFIKIPGYSWK